MTTELQVFVLVQVTVNSPLVQASRFTCTNNPHSDMYSYSHQCECSLTERLAQSCYSHRANR